MTEGLFGGRLEVAKSVARQGGQRALELFRARDTLNIESKGAQDRVTAADRAVQSLIFEAISERFPADDFVGEESDSGDLPARTDGSLWVVDPIDGTDCFVFGLPSWCVSIAWMEDGETKLGVIYDPVHDELFAAGLGHGASLNGAPLKISAAADTGAGLIGIGYSLRVTPQETLAPLSRLMDGGGMFHRCGSGALSLAWVAAGRLIGYYEPHMNAWDCLAGLLLVREAGGWTNDFLDNDGLRRGGPAAAAAPGVVRHIRAIGGLDTPSVGAASEAVR